MTHLCVGRFDEAVSAGWDMTRVYAGHDEFISFVSEMWLIYTWDIMHS